MNTVASQKMKLENLVQESSILLIFSLSSIQSYVSFSHRDETPRGAELLTERTEGDQ